MWKMSKTLAVCVFAAAWWGIFYPELCFSEETCVRVQEESVQDGNGERQAQAKSVQEESEETPEQAERMRKQEKGQRGRSEEIDAADLWRASGDEVVIGSRLWEWCEEKWSDSPQNTAKDPSTGRQMERSK